MTPQWATCVRFFRWWVGFGGVVARFLDSGPCHRIIQGKMTLERVFGVTLFGIGLMRADMCWEMSHLLNCSCEMAISFSCVARKSSQFNGAPLATTTNQTLDG